MALINCRQQVQSPFSAKPIVPSLTTQAVPPTPPTEGRISKQSCSSNNQHSWELAWPQQVPWPRDLADVQLLLVWIGFAEDIDLSSKVHNQWQFRSIAAHLQPHISALLLERLLLQCLHQVHRRMRSTMVWATGLSDPLVMICCMPAESSCIKMM